MDDDAANLPLLAELGIAGTGPGDWAQLGVALYEQQRFAEAAAAFRRSLAGNARDAEVWSNLGAAEQRRGRLEAAQQAYEQSLALAPGNVDALGNYAYLLAVRGDALQSIELLRGLLSRHPENREALHNLALVLLLQWSPVEAEACIRKLLSLEPQDAAAQSLLAAILQAQGQIPEAIVAFRESLAVQPHPLRHSKLLLALQYAEGVTPQALLAEHRAWEASYSASWRDVLSPPANPASNNRPLRIGFVSGDFGQHPIGFLALPAIESLDRTRCTVICYSDRLQADHLTERFQATSDLWRDMNALSDNDLAAQVRRDEIDILVDLMGHTGDCLLMFARRPAPLQIAWLGYAGTTGLSAIDYLLADAIHVSPGEEAWYTERVLRLPECYACYEPPPDAPDVNTLPALADRPFTFGCFNNPAKHSPAIIGAWCKILHRTPKAQLLLQYGGLDQPLVAERLRRQFAARGIDPDRIILAGHVSHRDLLASYHRVDLALDTQPYSGGLTTCEALWMGVPVVTFPGHTFAGRHSTSYLSHCGCESFVAADLAGYVELAASWPKRLAELATWRASLRERMRQSAVCNAPRFADNLLGLLERTWRSHVYS